MPKRNDIVQLGDNQTEPFERSLSGEALAELQ